MLASAQSYLYAKAIFSGRQRGVPTNHTENGFYINTDTRSVSLLFSY